MPESTNIAQPPKMVPPKGELPPTVWESYGWLGALLISAIALILVFVARKRVPTPVPAPAPESIARQRLADVPTRPATPGDALKIAHALREYLIAIFFIPCDAMTTEELLPTLRRQRGLAPELLTDIETLLRDCDHTAFSTAPDRNQTTPLVEQAKLLVERLIMAQRAREQTRISATAGHANP